MTESDPNPSPLVDGDILRRQLTAIAQGDISDESGRSKAALALFRDTRGKLLEAAQEMLFSGAEGRRVVKALALGHDVIIQALYDYTTVHVYRASNPTEAERISLVAVGGYGRGDLAPYSDIDLLFLLPYKQTPWGESVVEYMLYMLWDMGLKVGHATRTIKQCVELAKKDMTIRTSLLEMRYLWGDPGLFEELRETFWRDVVPGTDKEFIEAKLAERDNRHMRAGESRYLVEPNIKESKGGLRDLHTLFWIAKYLYRLEDGAELIQAGVFTDDEYDTVLRAYSFLWSVRCHLHFLAGRAEERLSFDVQQEMARRLHYRDRKQQSAVERFMKHYFLVAKDVGDLTRIFCAALEADRAMIWPGLGKLLRFAGRRRSWPEGFVMESGRLNVVHADVFKCDPVNVIRLFHIADSQSHDIHPNALKLIKRSLSLVDDDLRLDEEANRLFLEILTSRNDPERALRRMSEAGVLGRFLPVFGRVEALMQFNMYHHYTVDEHTIRAIGLLAKIDRGVLGDDHPVANEIIHKISGRRALYVGLFLHDLAKGTPDDHSVAGAHVARDLCPRLGMTAAETETVAWLVENHLVMSEFAQSRDLSDPKTIETFTNIVQSPERLRLLLVLTVADIRAVGPGVWNGWKGQLLRDLYHEAESVLSGGAAPGSATDREGRIAALQNIAFSPYQDWPPERQEFVRNRFSDAYWLAFDDDTLSRHAKFIVEHEHRDAAGAVSFETDVFKSITEVLIFAPDQPSLFARIAGALAASGASIKDAKAFVTSDGKALEVFYVQDRRGAPFDEPSSQKRLANMIDAILKQEGPSRYKVGRRRVPQREQAFSVEAEVHIDNQASDLHTLIEVSGRDRPGLLYDLASALARLRLSIGSAHVSTYGERAVDVFYVKDRGGLKITSQTATDAIHDALMVALDSRAEALTAHAAE